jgi:hypothetical protein
MNNKDKSELSIIHLSINSVKQKLLCNKPKTLVSNTDFYSKLNKYEQQGQI